MPFLEWALIRLAFVAAALFLVVLAVGPSRCRRCLGGAWGWLTQSRLAPAEGAGRRGRDHGKAIRQAKDVLSQSEAALAEIDRNTKKSEDNVTALQREARGLAA